MKKRFGIGINDERIPSGLMGKTKFAKKFEDQIHSSNILKMYYHKYFALKKIGRL